MNGEKKRSRCCRTKTIRKSTEKKQLAITINTCVSNDPAPTPNHPFCGASLPESIPYRASATSSNRWTIHIFLHAPPILLLSKHAWETGQSAWYILVRLDAPLLLLVKWHCIPLLRPLQTVAISCLHNFSCASVLFLNN
jgi:hypothetical protein